MKMTEGELQEVFKSMRVIRGEEKPSEVQTRLMSAKMEKSRMLEDKLDDIAREGEYKL